ncbi:succinyl-CoA ligase subunit beta [Candidatus Blochmanniella vafra str. BVAF]|uniref:Succinate--CoA ligase [ADP-forming] subunit beta n=1 Tax=Blochmanniella vafra (strain BVAF) TaxID=859654 RepID=E8Q6Y2_BLOVB|nr:ADP-forming succinate--CoA ligase subunit beta [Candidatus Blochmannia vafer]ADV33729.1 succinyl-CoA ligase subunit beta [Candidatus Blochmannia vafer str. BVAF]
MTNLYEYQAKKLFRKFKIPILKNWIFSDISEIKHCTSSVIMDGPPWIVKCQIHSGGRGKAGGVKVANSLEDIYSFATHWLGNRLITDQTSKKGDVVNYILVEPAIKFINEFYFSLFIDRDSSQILCIVSVKGGIDIENTINKSPDLIFKISIDPMVGAYPYQGRILADKLNLKGIEINKFVQIYIDIVRMFLENDLTLVEINPFIIDNNHNLLCLDAKVSVDSNSFFRQPNLLSLCLNKHSTNNLNNKLVPLSQDLSINYVSLHGNIGCMVNGAGLAMATMDLIKSLGGEPANFLDIGGDTDMDSLMSAFTMILKKTSVKAVFVNIFGGIVCCDLVADGIIAVLTKNINNHVPVVIRLEGNNAILGHKKLINSKLNIFVVNNLLDAVHHTIELVK